MTTETLVTDGRVLFRKLAETMAAVDRIPKNGKNTFHNYKYATEADVSDAIRGELASRNVFFSCSTELVEVRSGKTPKGKDTLLSDVRATITFCCGETGWQHTITGCGTGDDPSDKGTYKGITGAVKYALMKTFLIPTGDDPEHGSDHQAPAAAKPKRATATNKGEQTVTAFTADALVKALIDGGKYDVDSATDLVLGKTRTETWALGQLKRLAEAADQPPVEAEPEPAAV